MARLSDRVVVALQCQAISWAILLKVAFGGKQGNRNWLISRIRVNSVPFRSLYHMGLAAAAMVRGMAPQAGKAACSQRLRRPGQPRR